MGVGVGLPEMLANFISGLIIRLERSIRVGDTDGLVTKIRIRATTAVDSVRSTRSPLSRGIHQSRDHGEDHGARPPQHEDAGQPLHDRDESPFRRRYDVAVPDGGIGGGGEIDGGIEVPADLPPVEQCPQTDLGQVEQQQGGEKLDHEAQGVKQGVTSLGIHPRPQLQDPREPAHQMDSDRHRHEGKGRDELTQGAPPAPMA